jgi:NAD-dependent DNA ligase
MKFTLEQKRAMRRDPLKFAKSLTLAQLNAVLQELDDRYRANAEVIGDETYDIMDDYRWSISKKKKTEKNVGGVKNADITLEVPMASLDKFRVLSPARQIAFMKATSYVLSDKEDGISLSITYDGGVPILATTRGKAGLVGKDVSKAIPYMKIPKKIAFKGRFIVRAEFTIDKTTFKKFFPDDKTGRNTAGGLLNRNVAHTDMKKFRVVCYEILKGITAGGPLENQLKKLEQYGFDVVPYIVVKKITPEILEKYHDQRKKEAGRDIDGVVVTQNKAYKVTAGYPTHAYAFKINSLANAIELVVKDVVWEETRYGKWFPRITIEPTIIGGVEVSWFTGHNAFYIEHGYLKPKPKEKAPYAPRPINKGTVIKAVRSGDVIPYIMEIVKGAKKASLPPGPYEREADGVHFRVVHDEKSNLRTIKELTYFFTVLEVDGVKQGVITKLVDAGYDTVKKIMKMTMQDLQALPRSADTSAAKLHKALKDARSRMTFQNVAQGSAAFGEGIGEKRLQYIVDDIPDLLDSDWSVDELAERIGKVKGFNKLAHQIAENFSVFLKFCKRNGIKLTEAKKAEVTGSKMSGQVVLFTSVRDKQLQEWIIANGGKIASTVKQATLLIVKDDNASNEKTKEAKSLGKPILSLASFRKKHGI